MAGTAFKSGPTAVPSAVTNQFNPVANTYALVRHIHIANTNAAARTFSAWIGLTGGSAAGTAIVEGKNIPGNDVLDLYFPAGLRMVAADFLTWQSSVDSTSLEGTITGENYAL